MATDLQLIWKPSGIKQVNAEARTLTSGEPAIAQSAGRFRTVTSITRRNGLYCVCGGASQSVVVEVYDQLIDTSTGEVILTSGTATCTCRGTGPSSENIATTSFTGISRVNSHRIISAWQSGVLKIRRTATVKSYTSSSHGTPYFRSGYYDDIITINGTTAAYDPMLTISAFDATNPALLYAASWSQHPFSFTLETTVADSSNWENADSIYRKLEVKIENLSGGSVPGTVSSAVTTGTSTRWSVSSTALAFTFTNGFNRGNRYRVTFTLSVGAGSDDISETVSDYMEIDVAAIPMHLSKYGHGVGIGMYSAIDADKDAKGEDSRLDCNFPAYFHEPAYLYGGIAQIGDGSQNVFEVMGVQAGSVEGSTSTSGKTVDYDVVFDKTYAAAPVVVIGMQLGGALADSYYAGRLSCALISVSTTGFKVRTYNFTASGEAVNIGFTWAAFGRIA